MATSRQSAPAPVRLLRPNDTASSNRGPKKTFPIICRAGACLFKDAYRHRDHAKALLWSLRRPPMHMPVLDWPRMQIDQCYGLPQGGDVMQGGLDDDRGFCCALGIRTGSSGLVKVKTIRTHPQHTRQPSTHLTSTPPYNQKWPATPLPASAPHAPASPAAASAPLATPRYVIKVCMRSGGRS